jgi:peptide-methionine (S)-S-oxide reductase
LQYIELEAMMALEQITLGGGCFWTTEAAFQQTRGVKSVMPGYCGGTETAPTYELVEDGNTGHAEVVLVQFDNVRVSLVELLDVFFVLHDPTSLNRQGNDVGTQYRSVIFFQTPEQEAIVWQYIRSAARVFEKPIVTEVKHVDTFYPAEEPHHNYYRNHDHERYCAAVVAPKIAKVRQFLTEKLPEAPVDLRVRKFPYLAYQISQ